MVFFLEIKVICSVTHQLRITDLDTSNRPKHPSSHFKTTAPLHVTLLYIYNTPGTKNFIFGKLHTTIFFVLFYN